MKDKAIYNALKYKRYCVKQMKRNIKRSNWSIITINVGSTHRRSQDFWLGGPKPQITCNDVIRNFRKRNFLWGKDIVEWKIWNRSLMALKGGESSSQFRWFTIAKIELYFLIFFVLGLRLQRYSTNTKRYPPEKSVWKLWVLIFPPKPQFSKPSGLL